MRCLLMTKYIVSILLLISVVGSLVGDIGDFGFKPLRRKLKFVEEFYRLYVQNYNASTASTERNLVYLQYALKSPYIHPIQALCTIKTVQQHEKYKLLLRTRILYLLAKGFVQLGYRYDKEDIYFFNREFKKDLRTGFDIAEFRYKQAAIYWKQTMATAKRALQNRKVKVKGAHIEAIINEASRILYGDLDYQRVIDFRLKELVRKRKKLDKF